jgi:hypothetical protein
MIILVSVFWTLSIALMSNTAPLSKTFRELIILFINLYFIGIGDLNPVLRGCQPNFNFQLNSSACACVTHG